ncbi:MAG TPA: hypothetical protein VK797_13460 [Tepidisphaeraceae bacterium]|nr:hypothetical protein [Tepidisphaeraceae bacterium]
MPQRSPAPAGLNADMVVEPHHALNSFIGYRGSGVMFRRTREATHVTLSVEVTIDAEAKGAVPEQELHREGEWTG